MKKLLLAILFALVMHQNCSAADSFSSIEGTKWSYALSFVNSIGFFEGKIWDCWDGDCLIYDSATYTDYSYTIQNKKGGKAFGILNPMLGIGLSYDQLRDFPFYFISPKLHPTVLTDRKFEPVCIAGWRNQDGELVSDYNACPEGDTCTCGNYENL